MGSGVFKSVLAVGVRLVVLWSALATSIICRAGDTDTPPSYSDISWVTASFPPASWQDETDGSPRGVFIDILRAIAGNEVDFSSIGFHPWPRGMHLVSHTPMTSLFAISKTPERQKTMKFSDTVLNSRFGILCRKSVITNLKADGKIPQTYQMGKSLKDKSPIAHLTIGVVINDAVEEHIRQNEIKPKGIVRTTSFKRLVNRLKHGRVDAIAFNVASGLWKFKELAKIKKGMAYEQFETIYILADDPIAFAFHKDTPQALLDRFNKDLARVKAAGTIDAIFAKYLR